MSSFIKKFKLVSVFSLLVFGCFQSACGQKTFDEKMQSLYSKTVPLIKADDLESKLSQDIVILDTRSPKEFEISHIEGAQLIVYDKFRKSDVKSIDKNQEVIVYCSVGYRSEKIGEKLQEMGFKNVKNLYGGIFDWKNNDKIIFNNSSTETDSVHTYNKDWSQWLYKGIKVYE